MEYLAGLTNMVTLAVGGQGLTDNGLKHLSNMKKLDSLTITGNFTDEGLRYLEGFKALRRLEITSNNKFSRAALNRLRRNLPNLHTFNINRNNESKRASGNKSK